MVLLVKGGERLIMRPCNLAHSSRAFEDFRGASAGKSLGSGDPRGTAHPSCPHPLSRAAGTLHPLHPGRPKLRFKERTLGPTNVFLLLFLFCLRVCGFFGRLTGSHLMKRPFSGSQPPFNPVPLVVVTTPQP